MGTSLDPIVTFKTIALPAFAFDLGQCSTRIPPHTNSLDIRGETNMDFRPTYFRRATASVLMLALCATGALADAIDGDWCMGAKTMSIRGPDIVTPGGQRMKGDYTRHSFSYVVPAGEPGAGEPVAMILRGEYLLHVRQGGQDAPLQEWRRCSARTS
jgi:hypothetical protein